MYYVITYTTKKKQKVNLFFNDLDELVYWLKLKYRFHRYVADRFYISQMSGDPEETKKALDLHFVSGFYEYDATERVFNIRLGLKNYILLKERKK